MSARFYINWPLAPGRVTLEGAEAHHLAAVCRLRPGDAVCLFNGTGHEYPAHVLEVAKRSVTLEIDGIASPNRELPFALEVAAPVPKGDRAQFLIEKLTELGVTTFVPLLSERSVLQPREAKLEKLQRYVIEASKQCGRNVLMQIEPLTEWRDFAPRQELRQIRWLAHPLGGSGITRLTAITQPVRIAVGPEGGFTQQEIALGATHGWELIGLGPRILRIETAAIALACFAIGVPATPG